MDLYLEDNAMPVLILAGYLILLLLGLAGCGPDSSEQTKQQAEAAASYLVVKGSDTMVHLVSAWAEEFMRQQPRLEISVTGGGSGTGIAGLINGTTDICASSRAINDKERELAAARGVQPVEFKVALDGIAVIVHPQNQVESLTLGQLEDLFTGRITNWRQVGGEELRVLVFSRESSSGTYVFFQQRVMNRQDYTPGARLLPGTSALLQAVSSDRGALGYVGLGYAKEAAGKIKVIRIRDEDGAEIGPAAQSVKDGSYPIARPLFLYTNGAPRQAVGQFVDFTLSAAGQSIVSAAGYITVSP